MCQNCIGQRTFGELVELPAIADPVDCVDCGAESVKRKSNDGDAYCDDCYCAKFITCDSCDKEVDRDDGRTDSVGTEYCDDCYNELYVTCDKCSEEVSVDDYRSVEDRRYSCLCVGCYDDLFCDCADCNATVRIDSTYTNDSDDRICESCYSDNYCTCEACNATIRTDDARYSESRGCHYCDGCGPSEDGDFDAKRFRPIDNTCERTGSMRTYGVELETSECEGHMDLEGRFCFSSKEDGSIQGKEFVSTVLSGDAGLDEITDFCESATGRGFKFDTTCGFHAHFGVGNEDVTALKAIACAYNLTYDVWSSFVSATRRKNSYCGANKWDSDDLTSISTVEEFTDWANDLDRYQWLNLAAYAVHRTFEIRLHAGTLNAEKVCNWVIAHVKFIDWAAGRTMAQVEREFSGLSVQAKFNKLADILGDTDLVAFLTSRAAKFGAALGNPAHYASVA